MSVGVGWRSRVLSLITITCYNVNSTVCWTQCANHQPILILHDRERVLLEVGVFSYHPLDSLISQMWNYCPNRWHSRFGDPY
ncbi:hypothetical protein L211DRAFT_590556 [Terfezia boudieri ATCC MYA-4762]|uniref:Uncharacterized protein n=1 Tax=Terfezia boudieri ATCC MYA-4762 TaxID=1051890 RepID=A0A3N4LDF4_9PEZI|nr:hypothetical protein L211DRAFT_590556 [Terfezia boudieri ATCC MYA-4762]